MPFYLAIGSLAQWTNQETMMAGVGLEIRERWKKPSLVTGMVVDYLVSSTDKEFDGESKKSYKALRAY